MPVDRDSRTGDAGLRRPGAAVTRRPGRTRAGVTIADVADAAGVSRATVSRVVNDLATVDPAIAERVRDAVERLGYEPSRVARSLSLGITHTVGVVVPDLANPTFQQMLHGLNRAAAPTGYRMLVADSEETVADEAALIEEARRRSDAVVIMSPRMPHRDLTEFVRKVAPVVVVGRDDVLDAGRVLIDYPHGMIALAEHLIGLGHRRLLHLQGPAASAAQAARERGLASVEAAHPDVEIVRTPCGSTVDDGYAALDAVLASGASGVLAFNDLVALGLLGAAAAAAVPVPQRFSVVGFDDIRFAEFSTPPLTTVHVSPVEVGAAAWHALQRRMAGEPDAAPTVFTPELVVRASTAAPAV